MDKAAVSKIIRDYEGRRRYYQEVAEINRKKIKEARATHTNCDFERSDLTRVSDLDQLCAQVIIDLEGLL